MTSSDRQGAAALAETQAGAVAGAVRILADGLRELEFEAALRAVRHLSGGRGRRWIRPLMLLCAPLLGALDDRSKRALAEATGGEHVFSAETATALNILLDFLLYPVLGYLAGLAAGNPPLTESDRGWILLGIMLATGETLVRLREGIFGARPANQIRLGGSLYGTPVGWLLAPLIERVVRWRRSGVIPVDGYFTPEFESKRERERRYGEVYAVEEHDGGAYIRMELPRRIPPSAARDRLGLSEEMPDYDLKIAIEPEQVVVRGSVPDPDVRAVFAVSPACPTDFETRIPVAGPVAGYAWRYRDKLLEIVVVRKGALADENGSNHRARG
ncbi:MAG: hypothetical protein D6815_03465 [Candidatus Dadabacteria bacterium]|nr:MAG: hypothetical protein D6815_03465 [Candidatus Dadabacteria bacterium]